MDFGALLHAAKKNSENGNSNSNKFYSTKFAPPKKENKSEKKLSENIKRFLEKKEQEEREKARSEKQKLNNLLNMRDEKSKNKIRKMLKVTKSANRSVLDDVDTSRTAGTDEGLVQPDEDDYGYVSNAAAELFKKYVDKVGQLPEEKKFSTSRPATIKDLSSTKDRVKAAIMKEQEEKSGKSKSSSTISSTSVASVSSRTAKDDFSRKPRRDVYDPNAEKEAEEQRRKEELSKKVKLKSNRPAPPPMDFQDLLKLAEKKQFEPLEVKQEEKKKEPERLLTKKEKIEMEERKRYLEEKERRKKNLESNGKEAVVINKMQPNGRIPKLNGTPNSSAQKPIKNPIEPDRKPKINSSVPLSSKSNGFTNTSQRDKESQSKVSKDIRTHPSNNKVNGTTNGTVKNIRPISNGGSSSLKNAPKTNGSVSTNKPASNSSIAKPVSNSTHKQVPTKERKPLPKDIKTREFPPKDIQKTRDFPPKDIQKTREFPPKDIQKTREFPPKDIQKTRQFPPPDIRRAKPEKKPIKRRILDDDEDEYDSELDDFIDDGPVDEYAGGYSKYIKEIFGYDKSRYRDDDFDDAVMESSFAQQMREETISKKIGLMEDLEDMKQEAIDKKRKIERMKKMKYK